MNTTPADSEWVDQPLALTRADFDATSDKVMWIRLPKPRWTGAVQIGFAHETARSLTPQVTEQTVCESLRVFEGSESLRRIGESRFIVQVEGADATLARVRVQAKCKFCNFVADSTADIQRHIESQHLNTIFCPLEYAEYIKRNPKLPTRIGVCTQPSCTFVAHEYPPQRLSDIMSSHTHAEKHAHTSYRELTKIEDIRAQFPNLIPDIRKCKLCDWEKEKPSKEDLLRHLKENHPTALYKLD
ncbi:MAG: hypothetical protein HZC40_16375 [Chloroflexi bacterium]|nr:hypothetical protein [Chloroflexota bacterium]